MMKRLLCLLLCCMSFVLEAKPIEIPFWHSFAGQLGKTLADITASFNKQQKQYRVILVYKGSYLETLTSFVAAFRAKEQPPLVQIYEIGTATMLHPTGIVKPIYQLFNGRGNQFHFLPAIATYYSDNEHRLLAMPFNSSSAVLYYNRSLLKKAGFHTPPKTWPEVEKVSRKLIKLKLAPCGVTTTFPSWIQIETFLNWHGLSYVKDSRNIDDLNIQLDYGSKALTYHLKQLAIWQSEGIFEYGGRDSSAVSLFTSGHCAMLTQSSGAYMGLSDMVSFQLGVSSLPYWPAFREKEINTVIGGASIWVIEGFDKPTYEGVKAYLSYLSAPKVQSYWQRQTGYLPLSQEAMRLSNQAKSNPTEEVSEIAISQISASDKRSPGARLGYYAQIRLFNDEQIEAICAGTKSVKQALQEAKAQSDYLLRRFAKNVSGA